MTWRDQRQGQFIYFIYLFIYLGFYVAFNTVQVISQWVVGRAEETSTYSSLGFCSVNCGPTASNYQLSHLRPCQGIEPWPQKWEARVLPLCHRGPSKRQAQSQKYFSHKEQLWNILKTLVILNDQRQGQNQK